MGYKVIALKKGLEKNYKKYYATKTRIESVGYQEMLRDYVRSQQYIPGVEIKENPRTPKSFRLESLQPMFASGKIYILKKQRELVDELLMYPRSKHDDLLDGLFYSNKNIYPPYHESVSIKNDVSYREETEIFWELA